MDKNFLKCVPSIEQAKIEKRFYARIYIPYSLTAWYVVGADDVCGDCKLFVVEKRFNWIFGLLKLNAKIVRLFELERDFDNLEVEQFGVSKYSFDVFEHINGLNE